jgi:hypothetical protein
MLHARWRLLLNLKKSDKKYSYTDFFDKNAKLSLNSCLFTIFLIKYGYQICLSLQTAYCKL